MHAVSGVRNACYVGGDQTLEVRLVRGGASSLETPSRRQALEVPLTACGGIQGRLIAVVSMARRMFAPERLARRCIVPPTLGQAR
jgi:hypothetical protein